jgi:hypothetical protein
MTAPLRPPDHRIRKVNVRDVSGMLVERVGATARDGS